MTLARFSLIRVFSLATSGLLSAHAATPAAAKAAEPKPAGVSEEVLDSIDRSNIQLFVSAGDYDRLQAYLADVLTRLVNGHPNSRLDQLLPWAYVA